MLEIKFKVNVQDTYPSYNRLHIHQSKFGLDLEFDIFISL